jgi:bacteriocin biosynthesis cyclodehydratase domain-containing protein
VTRDEAREAREAGRSGVVAVQGLVTADQGAPPHGGAPRYRLRSSIEPFFADDGDVYLLRPGTGHEHVVRQPSADDRALLERLVREPVEAPVDSTIAARLAPLVDAGIVLAEPTSPPLAPEEAARFDRQLPYLAELGDPHELQRRLRASSVTVIGCGGLGTWALGALASAGVGRLVLVDDDTVELSNLNRQIVYRAGDVGSRKVELSAAWVRAFDPTIDVAARVERIRGPEAVAAVLDGADALLVTADWPPYELVRWVNQACVERRVPFITCGEAPPVLKIGPTYAPGRSACFACHEHQLRRDYPLYEQLAGKRAADPRPATTLGPPSGVIGTLLALEVFHLLVDECHVATMDRALLLDMRTLETHWEAIERDPECEVCSSLYRD